MSTTIGAILGAVTFFVAILAFVYREWKDLKRAEKAREAAFAEDERYVASLKWANVEELPKDVVEAYDKGIMSNDQMAVLLSACGHDVSKMEPFAKGKEHGARMSREKEHGRSHESVAGIAYCLCGKKGVLSKKFDAYYCPLSGAWLEDACDDPLCSTCKGRPKTVLG